MINKKAKGSGAIIFFILLIVAFSIWGFIGGSEAQSIGVTCDMGIGDSLCWKWHTNTFGSIQEGVNNIFRGG